MNIIRRNANPLSAFRPRSVDDQFGRLIEHMFDDMFSPFAQAGALAQWPTEGTTNPRLNVAENEKSFEVQVEMPGVNKEDIKVAIENQRVTIEGETRREDEQREGENLIYAERSARKFVRSFMLPTEVDESTAQARLENGVLMLSLPKKQGNAATRLTIQ